MSPSKQSTIGKRHGTRSSLAKTTHLPPCNGPKLHKFEYSDSPIHWMERIDPARKASEGIDSFVFRVEINRKEYALKVFKPFDVSARQWRFESIIDRKLDKQETTYHLHPFFAECRAYGRLNEMRFRNSAAIAMVAPCHGFLFLSQSDEETLHTYDIDLERNNFGTVDFTRHPIPAIVKDFISPGEGINSKNAPRILKGICALYDNGIFNQDVHADNFVDGKLVDFGSSWTEPHSILDSLPPPYQRSTRGADFVMFDDMIEEEKVDFDFRTNPALIDVVRNGGKVTEVYLRIISGRQPSKRVKLGQKMKSNEKAISRPSAKPNAKPKPKPKTKTKTKPRTKPRTKSKTKTKAKPGTKSNTKPADGSSLGNGHHNEEGT